MATQYKPVERSLGGGVYRAFHDAHRPSHVVVMLARDVFPKCDKCGDRVRFEWEEVDGSGLTAVREDEDFRLSA